MSIEENKAVIFRRVEEIWHNPDLASAMAAIDQLVAPDYVGHAPGLPDLVGREGFKQFLTIIRTAFPDLRFVADDLFGEGDRVVARYHGNGTHQGDYMGIPPTGKPTVITGMDIFRIANGQMAEDWLNIDQLGLLRQLGAIPVPGEAAAS
jgi:steroid delta-isomerase-like uncharacterized protein